MKELRLFLGRDVLIAAQRAGSATFAIALAIEPVACHTAILRVAECDQVLAAKSLQKFPTSGTLSDASVDDLYSLMRSMMLLSMLLIDE